MARNWCSHLLLCSEDRFCANLRVQEHEYDVTMLVPYVRVTSQNNCGDVTILSQKRPSLATMAKSAIDDCFYIGIVRSWHIKHRVRNKMIYSLPWITIFGSLLMRFANDLHSWLRHSGQSLANRLTRDPKIVIQGNSCINLYLFTQWVRVIEKWHKPVSIFEWLHKSMSLSSDTYYLAC